MTNFLVKKAPNKFPPMLHIHIHLPTKHDSLNTVRATKYATNGLSKFLATFVF
jgi:hypothetical protein